MPATTLLFALLLPGASLEPGWHHQYQGRLQPTQNEASPDKSFDLSCIVTSGGVYWSVQEEGCGAWPWSSQFGKITGLQDADSGPSLFYDQDSTTGVVELPPPLFAEPLAEGKTWTADRQKLSARSRDGAWQVRGVTPYGLTTELLVDRDQPLLRQLSRDVVLGQGQQFTLELALKKSQRLNEEQLAGATDQYERLLKLRSQLARPPRVRDNQWTKAEIKLLRAELPEGRPAAGLVSLLRAAREDLRRQSTRAGALQAMQRQALGKTIEFQLQGAQRGQRWDSRNLRGQVVVLHVWTYRSKPLEEPYGQVAYLDFLWRKAPQDQLAVLGVALAAEQGPTIEDRRSTAAREARKLADFMNLSYPLAVEDDQLLAALGDPRRADGQLPLVVVLDQQGKVVHYHAGAYEVDRQLGLKELQDMVTKTLAAGDSE